MKCLRQKICNVIKDFFHSSVESIMEKFAIVEKRNITEEEAKELLKILEEWVRGNGDAQSGYVFKTNRNKTTG